MSRYFSLAPRPVYDTLYETATLLSFIVSDDEGEGKMMITMMTCEMIAFPIFLSFSFW